jgi:hypothetical protein
MQACRKDTDVHPEAVGEGEAELGEEKLLPTIGPPSSLFA